MKGAPIHIIRVGLGITFLWIGVLIIEDPTSWGGLLQPWAAGLLPVPVAQAMYSTAALDILVGFFLLVDIYTGTAALVGLLHLLTVIITVGIDPITVRDIGLLAAALALVFAYWPEKRKPLR